MKERPYNYRFENHEANACPCCGSDDIHDQSYRMERLHEYQSGKIICTQCGLTMLTSCGSDEALIRWNKRIVSTEGGKG